MSSGDEDRVRRTKKQRPQRACDTCRRKKSDGLDSPDRLCSGCIAQNAECTYQGLYPRRRYSNNYVEKLKNRLAHMERLVEELSKTDSPQSAISNKTPYVAHPSKPRRQHSTADHALSLPPHPPGSSEDFETSSSEDDDGFEGVVEGIRHMTVGSDDRYHGKSSGVAFLRTAISMKKPYVKPRDDPFERPLPRPLSAVIEDGPLFTDYPPPELLNTLVELYFRNVNDLTPLLHEPTFRKALADGLHHRHGGFGGTVLLVCANASRIIQDPSLGPHDRENGRPPGWGWFEQVLNTRKFTLAAAQLYDLQIYVLMATYMHSTHAPHTIWPFVGAGIRMAVDAGVHRRKRYGPTATVEGELWKRAFWSLVYYEWLSAYGLGRPACIHDEDIDLDLPAEVDDEYWTTPEGEPLFQQPPGKPSKVSFSVCLIRLSQILAFASKTIFSSSKSRAQLGQGDLRWEERIVADIDSALNKWMIALPDHLRWDEKHDDPLMRMQSATLFAHHCHAQIAVHRLFISAAHRDSPLSFPSIIICTNAARAAIHTLHALYKRNGSPYCINMGTLFMSSVVLLMNVVSQKRSGNSTNAIGDLELVRTVIMMMRSMDRELPVSVAFCDLLTDILTSASAAAEVHDHATWTNTAFGSRNSPVTQHVQSNLAPQSWNSPIGATTVPLHPMSPSSIQHVSFNAQGYSPGYEPFTRQPPAASQLGHLDSLKGAYADASLYSVASSRSTNPQLPNHLQPQGHFQGHHEAGFSASPFDGTQVVSSQNGECQYPPHLPYGPELLASSEPMTTTPATSDSPADGVASTLAEGCSQPSSSSFNLAEFGSMGEMVDMWSNAPAAFGWDDWRTYFSNTNDPANFNNFTLT